MADEDPRPREFQGSVAGEFGASGGLMGALIAGRDWSDSPLGPPASWPLSLKTTVGLILPADAQIALFWGPQFVALYNDAYAPAIGDRHPRALGRPAEENWSELWDDLRALLQSVRDTGHTVTARDRPFYVERHGYPETVYFDISYSAVPDESGGVGGVLCIVRETTDRVLADKRNLADRERFEQMFAQSPAFMAMLSGREHVYEMANPAYLRLIGSRPPIIGKPIREALPELEGQGFFELLDQVYASGEPHVGFGTRVSINQEPGRPPEDRFVDFVYQPLKDADGKVTGILAQGSDVTDRKRMELALGESEQRFRTFFEGASVGMIEIDAQWRILESNPAYQEITGYSGDDLSGMDCLAFTHPDDIERTRAQLHGLSQSGDRVSFEKRYVRKDGSVVWIRSNIARIGDGSKLLKIVEDVSERRRTEEALTALNETLESRVGEEIERRSQAEEALRQAQKMETVGQLSGGIAHDFNNLLQIIQGNLTMLHHALPGDQPKWQRFVGNALTGTERAAALTQRLLAFSRRQPLRARPVDLNQMIREMGELLQRTIGETVRIEMQLEENLAAAQVDQNQLENAILNLAINARDAMPGGGQLLISTSSAEIDQAYAASHPDADAGSYVRVSVTDTGSGMSPEVLTRAVEPFFTTKEVGQGTGLGLSMVYGFVKQSGGHVDIRSVEGEGTTIELFLPRAASEPETEKVVGPAGTLRRGRGETILVCEDDADVRDFSTTTLRELGYEVREASDAAEALAILRQAEDIDLLFTDVVLPGGTNGAELGRQARMLRPGLKVLLTTGYARTALDDTDVHPPLELLSKPFSVERLGVRLRQLLD